MNLPKKLEEWQNLPEAIDMKDDMSILYQAAKTNHPSFILELGSGGGLSTRALALAAKELSSGSNKVMVLSVDINQEKSNNVAQKIKNEGLEDYVMFAVQDDIEFLRKNSHNPIDFVFLDTSHEYEHTLAEITMLAPRITSKGYFFLHDSRYNEVWLALQDFFKINNQFMYLDYTSPAGLGLLMRKYSIWLPVNTFLEESK